MCFPLSREYAIAIASLEFLSNRAVAFVNDNIAASFDKTKDVVARDRLATIGNFVA